MHMQMEDGGRWKMGVEWKRNGSGIMGVEWKWKGSGMEEVVVMNLVLELPQDLKPSSAHISAADARCPQVLRQMRAALRCCGRCALPSGVAAKIPIRICIYANP